MPRLAEEEIVGADSIFACLGPALEIFSRYSHVEKASGQRVELREYLEQVWGAVAREALGTIFQADVSGLEPDSRLTAIWFWTLKAAANGNGNASGGEKSNGSRKGYPMDFDAARKLAQGLGVELEQLAGSGGILQIRGSSVSMMSIAQRRSVLLGTQSELFGGPHRGGGSARKPSAKLKAVSARESTLFDERPAAENTEQRFIPGMDPSKETRSVLERLADGGSTTLDRLHQAMLLFGGGHVALLGQFLERSGMAGQAMFWSLAQSLSALYPSGSDEKRWVDGVLARGKSLGMIASTLGSDRKEERVQ